MVTSREPALLETEAPNITDMELNASIDTEMSDVNHPLEQKEPAPQSPHIKTPLSEMNDLELTGIDPNIPENFDMKENDQSLAMDGSSLYQPDDEPAFPENSNSDVGGYMPTAEDDFDMIDQYDSIDFGEIMPFSEQTPPKNGGSDSPEANFTTPREVSPTKRSCPLDLGESSLGKSRSEKALSQESSENAAPAGFVGSESNSPFESVLDGSIEEHDGPNHVSPAENAQNGVPAAFGGSNHVSPAESVSDTNNAQPRSSTSTPATGSAGIIDLGQSALGKPKQVLNLGSSSLSKPANKAAREKAKATQARLAKQFAAKTAVQAGSSASGVPSSIDVGESAGSAPLNTSSPHGAGESAASTPSGGFFSPHVTGERGPSIASEIFTPSEFDAISDEIHPDQAAFEALEMLYLLKKSAGTNNVESDVAYLQARAKENARLQKVEIDERYERDERESEDVESNANPMFVTPNERTPASHAPASSGGGTPNDPALFTKAGKPRKRKAADSGDMAPPSKKAAKKSKAPTGRSLGGKKGGKGLTEDDINRTLDSMQTSSKKPVAAQSTTVVKKTKTNGRGPAHNISNVKSLMGGTDVFRDAEAVAGNSRQPAFKAGTTRKDNALRDLIASIPQDDRPAAAGDKKFLENSLKDFDGQGSCYPSEDGSGWKLRGMKCTLKHYQVLGISFMRRRENTSELPKGGILADEMGLGKTIQMIANIINGKPKAKQPRCTLIIASPALISQWHAEINKFTMSPKENKKHGIGRIIQHRAGYRQGGDEAQIREAIMESDICLTTYGEINRSYPKAIVPADITTERGKKEWWTQHFEENKGVFHRIKFLRVVLDEAQAIKNHNSHCSMACRALKSEYYWAISGTPLVNGIAEMYPYLKFLRHPHTGSMRTFQANFCSPNDPTGSEKLGVFLRQIIIRRTHKDLLFGARLLDLPTPKQNVIYLEFNAVERTVYEIVKQRFIQRINTITRRHGINSAAQYTHIWTMLLRLRQICCHVLLIQDTILDLLEREDFEKLEEISREVEGHSHDNIKVLEHLRYVLKEHTAAANAALDPDTASVAGIDVNVVPGGSSNSDSLLHGGVIPDLGGKHGKRYPFQKYLISAAQSEEMGAINERTKCCSCRLRPDTPQITSCHHIYCKACMRSVQHAAARGGLTAARCTECGNQFTDVKDLPTLGSLQAHQTDASSSSSSSGSPSTNGRGQKKKKKGKAAAAEKLDWIGQAGGVLPSAKTIACKAQILEWLSECPSCKIIVYTQFLPMIRIMGKVCQGEGWGHLKYAGNMSQTAREKALKEFATDKTKRIMLMSLKCGGLGLNIVAASRVLLLDPWWNDAVEQQAFCRVFRIGQVRETRLTRLCIKGSMDSAMFAVKERKTAEIDKVMHESKAQPISTQQLLELFGPVGEDEDGRPGFIFPERDEDEDEDGSEDDVAGRFYEREEEGGSFFHRGQREGFMGNDM